MYFDVANTALHVVIGKRFFYNPTPVSRRNQQVEVETKSWSWKSEYFQLPQSASVTVIAGDLNIPLLIVRFATSFNLI